MKSRHYNDRSLFSYPLRLGLYFCSVELACFFHGSEQNLAWEIFLLKGVHFHDSPHTQAAFKFGSSGSCSDFNSNVSSNLSCKHSRMLYDQILYIMILGSMVLKFSSNYLVYPPLPGLFGFVTSLDPCSQVPVPVLSSWAYAFCAHFSRLGALLRLLRPTWTFSFPSPLSVSADENLTGLVSSSLTLQNDQH